MTYGQQPPRQPWPGQYPPPQHPGYGPPPKKKRTGLVVGLVGGGVVLMLVVAFVVTAFIAPGFLRKPKSVPPPSLDLRQAAPLAEIFLNDIAASSPYKAADDTACAANKDEIINRAGDFIIGKAQLTAGSAYKASDDVIAVPITGTVKDKPFSGELKIKIEKSYRYCISEATRVP